MRCKYCGCTNETPCLGGCHWVEENICSTCDFLREALAEYYLCVHSVSRESFKALAADAAAIAKEVSRAPDDPAADIVIAR